MEPSVPWKHKTHSHEWNFLFFFFLTRWHSRRALVKGRELFLSRETHFSQPRLDLSERRLRLADGLIAGKDPQKHTQSRNVQLLSLVGISDAIVPLAWWKHFLLVRLCPLPHPRLSTFAGQLTTLTVGLWGISGRSSLPEELGDSSERDTR